MGEGLFVRAKALPQMRITSPCRQTFIILLSPLCWRQRSDHGSNSGKFLWLSAAFNTGKIWCVVLLWQLPVPVNFVAAHGDTVWYNARSPRLPIAGGACCPSSRTPTCSRPSALIFGPSGLIRQHLPSSQQSSFLPMYKGVDKNTGSANFQSQRMHQNAGFCI